jgi:hypothetical protein
LFLAGVPESVIVAIFEEIVGGVAGVWNGIGVAIKCSASSNLARVSYAVAIAVAFAEIWNGIVVAIGSSASSDLAQVAYAVAIAVALRGVRDRRAVVQGVDSAIAIGVDTCDCDSVVTAPRDA